MTFNLHVDEGHGGADSGAVGGGMLEDTRNLILGDAVAALANLQGWTVTRTRWTDVFVELKARYTQANAEMADAFVSIHHDWSAGAQAVIYANSNDTREVTSERLADSINDRINVQSDGIPNVGIYADRRGLAVLRGTNMPAVIVEASRVQDEYVVAMMAEMIVRGICDFKGVEFKPAAAPVPAPVPKFWMCAVFAGDAGLPVLRDTAKSINDPFAAHSVPLKAKDDTEMWALFMAKAYRRPEIMVQVKHLLNT